MVKALVFDAYGTIFDVQAVMSVIEEAFPGRGDFITQVWRLKQLEYSWLRSMMGRYEDFWTVTCESLSYTLKALGLEIEGGLFEEIAEAYNRLLPYPDADEALSALSGYRLMILSNGSPAMLEALLRNSGFGRHFEAAISVDGMRVFKPDPRAYEPVQSQMGLQPDDVLFVSSNGFDVLGAKSFGFRVARIERVTPEALKAKLGRDATIGSKAIFDALRSQEEACGAPPDFVVTSLSELPKLAADLSHVA